MAGALIIEGDIDEVPEIKAARDRLFMFQQFRIPHDDKTQRPTTRINGQLRPTIEMRPGEVQRWRFVHAGIDDKLTIALEYHDLHQIAFDGLTLGSIVSTKLVEMGPGYRTDILVKAGHARERPYLLLDAPDPEGLRKEPEQESVLAAVKVSGPPLDMELPKDQDLRGLRPHTSITKAEVSGKPRELIFAKKGSAPLNINALQYDEHRVDHILSLGGAEEWILRSDRIGPPPFHIHVNPFEVVEIANTKNGTVQPSHVWRDTILVSDDEIVTIRTRYSDFKGRFVLHCHNLDHEDGGMMQLIEIVPSDQLGQRRSRE
jgi:FtsP/CotA-like multicopper oxidase with cupredoxin domain